jgi:hypothetical protein
MPSLLRKAPVLQALLGPKALCARAHAFGCLPRAAAAFSHPASLAAVHAYSLMACTKAQAKSVFPVARELHASLQVYTRMQRCMRAPIAY